MRGLACPFGGHGNSVARHCSALACGLVRCRHLQAAAQRLRVLLPQVSELNLAAPVVGALPGVRLEDEARKKGRLLVAAILQAEVRRVCMCAYVRVCVCICGCPNY